MMANPVQVVTSEHVRKARIYLRQGLSLGEASVRVNVPTKRLDRALWLWIGERL